MKVRAHNARRLSTALAILIGTSGIALAQDAQIAPGSERPMFTVLKPALHAPQNQAQAKILAATTPLKTWNGSFSYAGKGYNYNMVGTQPSSNTTSTISTIVIPVKIVITARNKVKTVYDPNTVPSNTGGKSALANTVASPIFASSVDFVSAGIDVGQTQYIDAYQRANFWGTGDSGSHLLLGDRRFFRQSL